MWWSAEAERWEEIVINTSHCVEQIIIKNVILMVKEGAEGIAGTEELLKGGSRIAVELVCEVTVGSVWFAIRSVWNLWNKI